MISTERVDVLSPSFMSSRVSGLWWPKLRAIIGVLLAALTLAGCGNLMRLSYGQGPHLAYWWADGYLDLDGEQALRLREALDDWFDWHRRTQLPDYAALLARAQSEVLQPATPQLACAWRDEVEQRLERAIEQAAPALSRLMLTLKPEQLQHMERKLDKNGEDLAADFAQPDREARAQAAFKRALERYESFYGRLDETQRARLAERLAASPFDAERWLAERKRRNADMMRTLADVRAGGDVGRAQAAVLVLFERALRSPRAEYRAYQQRLRQDSCALAAAMHNLMTPEQRQHARRKLRGWEEDARLLAAQAGAGAQR
jgi:hypothetical protein